MAKLERKLTAHFGYGRQPELNIPVPPENYLAG